MKVKKLIVSPSKRYVCNTGKFLEINKAAFGAKFYFTDYKGNILYCVKNAYLHELIVSNTSNPHEITTDDSEFKLLQWSNDGNSVYFLEYSILASTMLYKSVFIDFDNQHVYVINENEYGMKLINELSVIGFSFDMHTIVAELTKHKLYPIELSRFSVEC
ncbi:MAG: hypothetical protein IPN39_00145 [Chitinophagaceae bacterium]|nr:hypothetical protein [Chitinophagaceae bacterium]MBL0304658.1 hypothetical protein [Chitinophagaceae bacterium]MBP8114431.1 hypothetical protein [Chitinophagaceae bacterium]MBP9105073.1 hypothetical protein [Chitinophagaceae bacterium]HQX72917.1 hypothetical protein [Chitinophagaceae bacterium]